MCHSQHRREVLRHGGLRNWNVCREQHHSRLGVGNLWADEGEEGVLASHRQYDCECFVYLDSSERFAALFKTRNIS